MIWRSRCIGLDLVRMKVVQTPWNTNKHMWSSITSLGHPSLHSVSQWSPFIEVLAGKMLSVPQTVVLPIHLGILGMPGVSRLAACCPEAYSLRWLLPNPSLAWWIEMVGQRRSRSAHSCMRRKSGSRACSSSTLRAQMSVLSSFR
jgi:hypothetical protein